MYTELTCFSFLVTRNFYGLFSPLKYDRMYGLYFGCWVSVCVRSACISLWYDLPVTSLCDLGC
jgi:hypothetical protein